VNRVAGCQLPVSEAISRGGDSGGNRVATGNL
jgi:hypothetical protein